MPKPASKRKSRFNYSAIVARVELAREAKGLSTKAMHEAIGMAGSAWYKKVNAKQSTFTLDELGAIAEALDAPEGWPFVEWKP